MDQPFSTYQHDNRIVVVDYSPSDDQLAVSDGDGVTIHHPTTHDVKHSQTLQGAVYAVAYSHDGKYLAAGGADKKVWIFEIADFEMVQQISFDYTVLAISFAADSKHMAVGGEDEKVHIFDIENDFNRIQQLQQENSVMALSYSSDGNSLLIGLLNNSIKVISATDFQQTKQIEVYHFVYSISQSFTGKYIAVGSNDKTIIYEADNLETTVKVYNLLGGNWTAFRPDGTTLTITNSNFITNNHTINHFDTSEWNDDTPIFYAAGTGDIEKLRSFNVKYKSPCGFTTLMKSSQYGSVEAVKFLLDNGANINEKNNDGKTALIYASEGGHSEAVKLLIERGADTMQHKSIPGGTNDSPKLVPDRLGYNIYAEAISTVATSVENPSASLCVGLIAPWGVGKTFIWRLIKEYFLKAATAYAEEIKKKDESMKQLVSRLEHTVVLALVAWCWVANMFVEIFCLNCSPVEEEEEVLNSSLKEEEKVALMMILIFPIGITVWMTCFLCVIIFYVIMFMLKVPFTVVYCCSRETTLEKLSELWKDLSEVEEAENDPVISDKFFFCWQHRNVTEFQRQDEEILELSAPLLTRRDPENQNQIEEGGSQNAQGLEVQSTTLKWSQVRNVLTGGGENLFSNRDFDHISSWGQIQIVFLASFQKLFRVYVTAISCMSFMFPKNFKIEQDMTKYIFVDFNAWVYSGTDLLWAKLIEMLWTSVENECGKFSVRWHRASISLSNEKKDDDIKTKYNERKAAIIFYVMKILIAFFFGSVVTCLLLFGLMNDEGKENDDNENYGFLDILLSSLSFCPTLYFIIKFAAIVLPEMLESRGAKILNQVQRFETFDRQNFSVQTGFMGEVEREVNYFFDFLRTTYVDDDKIKRRRPIRLVLFVDDLDRCPKNVVMQVLEAVTLLLVDAPITCYLAIDTRLVVTSIEEHFGDRFSQAGLDGYQYLEKIIQLPFCVPDLDIVCKENFLTKTLEGDMLDPLKLYQRLMHLHRENIPDILNIFEPHQSDPRNTKEAIEILIPCLEQMIEDNLFLVDNMLLHSPEEALKEIKKLSFNSNPEKKRIQDEFSHWISIGIENIIVKWRNDLSNYETESNVNGEEETPFSHWIYIQWISNGKHYILEKWNKYKNAISNDNAETVLPNPNSPAETDSPDDNPDESNSETDSESEMELTPAQNNGGDPDQISYDTLFTPLASSDELRWFRHYAKYFIGKPRKMKRIINSYMVARYISNSKRQQATDSLAFNKKLLRFTILLEQWPYRMAWVLLIVENFQQEMNVAAKAYTLTLPIGESIKSLIKKILMTEDLKKERYKNLSLIKIYLHIGQVLVHSSNDSETQLLRDGDAQMFEQILSHGENGEELKMKDIFLTEQGDMDSLRQYAFNLQRHTIEKVAAELNNCVLDVDQHDDIEEKLDWRISFKKKSKVFET